MGSIDISEIRVFWRVGSNTAPHDCATAYTGKAVGKHARIIGFSKRLFESNLLDFTGPRNNLLHRYWVQFSMTFRLPWNINYCIHFRYCGSPVIWIIHSITVYKKRAKKYSYQMMRHTIARKLIFSIEQVWL